MNNVQIGKIKIGKIVMVNYKKERSGSKKYVYRKCPKTFFCRNS